MYSVNGGSTKLSNIGTKIDKRMTLDKPMTFLIDRNTVLILHVLVFRKTLNSEIDLKHGKDHCWHDY